MAKIPNSQEVKNDNKGEIGIIVGFENSRPENVQIFLISNKEVVVRQKLVKILDTADVIKYMNDMAASEDGKEEPILQTYYDDEAADIEEAAGARVFGMRVATRTRKTF